MNKDIMLCGVGGQGTILASKIIASAAMREGQMVHSAETIGMAQRGGSVTSHIRIGEEASSPLIPYGYADMIISFEPAEAVRNLPYLKKDGIVIVSTSPTKPVTESLTDTGYDGVKEVEYLKSKVDVIEIDGADACKRLGSQKFLNIILLGLATGSGRLGISKETVIQEIKDRVPEKFKEANLKAFEYGIDIAGRV